MLHRIFESKNVFFFFIFSFNYLLNFNGNVFILHFDCSPHVWVCLPHVWVCLPHVWVCSTHVWVCLPHVWVCLPHVWVCPPLYGSVCPIYENRRQSWVLDSTLCIPDSRCWILAFVSGTWYQSLVGLWISLAVFWIPKPRISDSTSKKSRISDPISKIFLGSGP